ncbi:MAG: hypothetical protein DRH17_09380 [Deltaproteobacteria bacterium]|nr:Flp pilus assembly complex ATPase component TadA [Deltaproteobacteria bacterium]RLB81350.1 MAG: hypothetical protein DRH17_09380 [Deltaproteobacteria bacterium]
MIGEIQDHETAENVVRSALAIHPGFTTLHTHS